MLFKDKLPEDLYIAFQIIKVLIEKGYLNLIHDKDSHQHFNYLSSKRKLDNYKARFYISTLYTSISSIPAVPTFQHPYTRGKLPHDFILYARNFLHKMGSR